MRCSAFDAEKPTVKANKQILQYTNGRDENTNINIKAEIIVKYCIFGINHDYLLNDESQRSDV